MGREPMNLNNLPLNINLSQRAVMGICIAIASLAGITFFYSIWQWHSDWVLARQNAAPITIKTNEAANPDTSIPGEHIFGKSAAKLGEMPITNLQFQVTGIVKIDSDRPGAVSKAYISISGQPSKIYKIGDMLPYGVKVYEITPDAVVLENEGHLEKLPLPRNKLKFKSKHIEEHS
jgi:type II secretory pathway component PulC